MKKKFLIILIACIPLGIAIAVSHFILPPQVYVTDNMMDARKFSRACDGHLKISRENELIKMECHK